MMMHNCKLVRRLIRDQHGVAFIEFAFAAPMLLTLMLGGVELTNFLLAHMRVNQIAVTVADNAGRIPVAVDEANIYEVFAGARVLGQDITFEDHGRVVLSSLQNNGRTGTTAGQMIHWQRCWGKLAIAPSYGVQGKGRTDNTLSDGMGPTGHKIRAAAETAVMFVEVTYEYQPLIGRGWLDVGRIRHESAFNVRSRVNQDIANGSGLAVHTCA